MPVVITAVKNHPSNRASLDCTARTQRATSSCIFPSIIAGDGPELAKKRQHPAGPSWSPPRSPELDDQLDEQRETAIDAFVVTGGVQVELKTTGLGDDHRGDQGSLIRRAPVSHDESRHQLTAAGASTFYQRL